MKYFYKIYKLFRFIFSKNEFGVPYVCNPQKNIKHETTQTSRRGKR